MSSGFHRKVKRQGGGYRMIECDSHGKLRRQGHMVCASCERFYTTHDPELETHAPLVCACGVRLMPGKGPDGAELEFSGRICCAPCYAERAPAARGAS